ncbi:MAG: MBL fold metallo-hydrolase [Synechococcales bacterium]|nr:MBL fold metallo-hydrolase [Synechococcales bacterium]
MHLTWLDSNSWLIEMGGKRILLDPWLVGDLMFGQAKWFFRGYRQNDRPIPETIDLILLSQGLEDHAHLPTLQVLDKSIPVVGSPSAAKVAESLGFQQVTALQHHQLFTLDQSVKIQALIGSPVGPTTRENAYLLQDLHQGSTLYYEPHGYHSPDLKQQGEIDVVLTPMIDLKLPIVGAFIKGTESALQVAQWVRPQVMIPTAAGGDIEFEGFLIKLLSAEGSPSELQKRLTAVGLSTQVLEPKPGDRFLVPLKQTAIV